MGRRGEHSRDELRAMALAAAAELVGRHGLAALSARKVAARVGYSPATLYQLFRNIDDLILQVNATTLERLAAAVQRASCPELPAPARLQAMARAYLRFSHRHGSHWSALFEHRLASRQTLPAWYRQRISALFAPAEAVMASLAPDRPPPQVRLAARALWSGVHGICLLARDGKIGVTGIGSAQAAVDALLGYFLDGYMCGDPRP
jgi:AcrR family transcriptional regulator